MTDEQEALFSLLLGIDIYHVGYLYTCTINQFSESIEVVYSSTSLQEQD
jgi:hypothetical protein